MMILVCAGCSIEERPMNDLNSEQAFFSPAPVQEQEIEDEKPEEKELFFYQMDSMTDSAECFVKTVEAKGYKTITREEIIIQGETYPCTWVFAINDRGEFLDYVMMEPDKDALLEQAFDESLNGWRKEECGKFSQELGYTVYIAGPCSTRMLEYQNKFAWRIQGSIFAFEDIGIEPFASVYWQGEEKILKERPEGYPLSTGYLEARTMEQDIQALKDRLIHTEQNYTWEEKDAIEIGGVSYPVTWLSIQNEHNETMDVIWSEDTTLAYRLSMYSNRFLDFHATENKAYVEAHGGNQEIQLLQWIAQDCFYNGYSVYYTGRGFPLLDCGLKACVFELSPSGQNIVQWYDKNSYYDWETGEKVTSP